MILRKVRTNDKPSLALGLTFIDLRRLKSEGMVQIMVPPEFESNIDSLILTAAPTDGMAVGIIQQAINARSKANEPPKG